MSSRIILSLPFVLVACAPARAVEPRGSLTRDVRAAIHSMSEAGDTRLALPPSASKVICVDLHEIPDVVVCVFNTARFMNFALNRASEWIEKSPRRMLDDRAHAANEANAFVEGHDLRGVDLRAFEDAWRAARVSFEPVTHESDLEKLAIEREFWERSLRPRLAKKPDLVLLAVAAGTDIEGTLSHEILHAQYFRSEPMRKIVARYWEEAVSDADKKMAMDKLRKNYDVDGDAALLVNEFQAYVLMPRAEDFELAALVAAHRDPLRARLTAAGITPLQFRLDE